MNIRKLITIAALALGLCVGLGAFGGVASAQAPALLPMQGYLTDADGAAIEGDVDLTIGVYQTDIVAAPTYTETQTVGHRLHTR